MSLKPEIASTGGESSSVAGFMGEKVISEPNTAVPFLSWSVMMRRVIGSHRVDIVTSSESGDVLRA
jgi:hypothetical protein